MALRSYVQRGPIPITPSVIFSLGATPSRPKTDEGTMVGSVAAVLAMTVCLTNLRRERIELFDFMGRLAEEGKRAGGIGDGAMVYEPYCITIGP